METTPIGSIITVRTLGRSGRRVLIRTLALPINGIVLGRRVRRNDDGTTSTYGNDHAYRIIED